MTTKPIGIIGMGYVGLPLALTFAEAGCKVIGFDIDPDKVSALQQGRSYIKHIGPDRVHKLSATGLLSATHDFAEVAQCGTMLLCVPTPLDPHLEPDLQYVEATCRAIAPHLQANTLVILESTTWPGTTEEVVKTIIEAESERRLGKDLLIAYSPEREDPGNADFATGSIPKLVGGLDQASTDAAVTIYRKAIETVIPVSHAKVAESAKLLENIFRSVNIALVNELKTILTQMDINVWEVIDAAASKPFGFMRFNPGPGLGGHCIPIDPYYLSWKAKEFGIRTRFIELAGEINRRMPDWVVQRTMEALNEHGKALNGSKILLVGIAYKANVDDDRESPAYKIWELLASRGAAISYYDPHIPVIGPTREHPELAGIESIKLEQAEANEYDALLILTQHRVVDSARIGALSPIVINTRGPAIEGELGA